MAPSPINFGVLILPGYQLLDMVGAVDLINLHSYATLKHMDFPDSLVATAPQITWHYVSVDLKDIQPSVGPPQRPTCTYKDCPELDYLIVPGADYDMPLPEGCAEFLRSLMAKDSFKALLTVCTGSAVIAPSGVLDGHQVCNNKYILKVMADAGELGAKVKWLGDRRWNVDGKVWSAAGVTAGIDLAAEFARVHFNPEIVRLALDLAEYEPNPAQPDPFARLLDGVSLV